MEAAREQPEIWGLNILTYYPSFTSPNEPANKAFGLNCAGDCNGRMLIAINLRTHSINNPKWLDAPNMGDAIAKIDLQKRIIPKVSVVTDLGPEYGFDSGYEVHTPPKNGLSEQIKKYLFHLGTDGIHFDRTADCSVNQFARTCTLHFSLKCDPAIYVQVVAIDMRHIDDFSEVVSKT